MANLSKYERETAIAIENMTFRNETDAVFDTVIGEAFAFYGMQALGK